MTLTYDEEPLAEALAIQRMLGAAGPRWIAQRLGELIAAEDAAGVARFSTIASEYERLIMRSVQ